MYEVIKAVILSGVFELNDLLRKIDTLWLQSRLSDEQRAELVTLAQEHADPALSLDLMQMISALDARVKQLEGSSGEVPEYVDGHPARDGEVYLWQGKAYRCTLPQGVAVCVWSPDVMPDYWTALA